MGDLPCPSLCPGSKKKSGAMPAKQAANEHGGTRCCNISGVALTTCSILESVYLTSKMQLSDWYGQALISRYFWVMVRPKLTSLWSHLPSAMRAVLPKPRLISAQCRLNKGPEEGVRILKLRPDAAKLWDIWDIWDTCISLWSYTNSINNLIIQVLISWILNMDWL